MGNGIVASLRGDWVEVMRVMQMVFDGDTFILLAEDKDPFKPYYFTNDATKQDQILDAPSGLPYGRAFNRSRELRWRIRTGGGYTITYLSEESEPPAEIAWERINRHWEVTMGIQKLYGKKKRGETDWVEVGVPGITGVYEAVIDAAARRELLKLDVVDYALNGITQMTRFRAVSAYQVS